VTCALHRSGRPITDILTRARKRNSTATLDEDFGARLEDIIDSPRQPSHPPFGMMPDSSTAIGFIRKSPEITSEDPPFRPL
jgi:hypothetical protein